MNRLWKLLILGCLFALVLNTIIILQQLGSTRSKRHILDTIDTSNYFHTATHREQHNATSKDTHSAETITLEATYSRIRIPKMRITAFKPSQDNLFPPDSDFQAYEIGNCVNNGDSDMKKLSRNCGCPPEESPSYLHKCCRLLMLKMMKDVYVEMIKADIPFILTGLSVKGWLENNKRLNSYALDISAGVPYSYWYSDVYLGVMKHLASRGYCIWFRTPVWMKIWSSVIPIDIRPWSVVGEDVYFAGYNIGNPYKISSILPKQLGLLDGIQVYLPNKPEEYIDQYQGVKKSSFIPTKKLLFPPDPLFHTREEGSCKENGASELKNLPTTCGCGPDTEKSHNIHPCCRKHLLKLLKEIYAEMIYADIPMIVTGGAVIGWYRNKKLVPYDHDIDVGLEYKYWSSPRYLQCLDRLAKKGFCVWYKTPTWTKIWSTVVAFDIFAFNVVDGKELIFDGPRNVFDGPYNVSYILPRKLAVLEGIHIFLPNNPTKYIDQYQGVKKSSFIPTKKLLFPPDPLFHTREEGSCKENGASELKNLPTTCGCGPDTEKSHNIHPCCRKHLLKLLKEIYAEMIYADIPMIVTGGAVIGWYRNRKLVPYDHDIDGGLEYKYWSSPRYLQCLDRLAKKGFCVWYKTPTWTKIWSTVVAFDIFAFNVVDGKELIFDGPRNVFDGPYNVSYILPRKLAVLEGIHVFLPNNPTKYMDRLYGKGRWKKPWYS